MVLPRLTPNQIEQLARIMGDTDGDERGLKSFEIGHNLTQCYMDDPGQGTTKWKRLYNAFCRAVNSSSSTNNFIVYGKTINNF